MGSESLQSKLDRVRRPRVQIKYEVETEGAMEIKELPFVLGVLADLSGQPKEALKPMKDRKFVQIDTETFSRVMEQNAPRVAVKVQNKLTDENTNLNVELTFKEIGDFDPGRIAEQVPALRELLEMRRKLDHLLSKMEGNDKLEQKLAEVLADTEKAMALAKELGVAPGEEKPAETKEGA